MSANVTAVIVAAGNSRRIRTVCKNKLLLKLNGSEVLARTLLNYQKAETINSIIVVTQPAMFDTVAKMVDTYNITKYCKTVEGGDSRMLSVANGVEACPDQTEYVAIADGARPFTHPEDIDRVTQAAERCGGALLCVPVKDTIKVLSPVGNIDNTPNRSLLVQAQTPQTFLKSKFVELICKALTDDLAVTDDASIFEIYGEPVLPVIGRYDNIKITTKEDLELAQAIANSKECSE